MAHQITTNPLHQFFNHSLIGFLGRVCCFIVWKFSIDETGCSETPRISTVRHSYEYVCLVLDEHCVTTRSTKETRTARQNRTDNRRPEQQLTANKAKAPPARISCALKPHCRRLRSHLCYTAMFQWSTNRRRTSESTYPANRTGNVVTGIQGTIRPPEKYTRVQHLESYLNDATLKRSTRRIPPGKPKCLLCFNSIDASFMP